MGLIVPLLIEITGTTPGLEFPQLTVTGSISLDERLMLTSTIPGTAGDSLLVDNDGTDPVIGHFSGVGEGDYLAWPGSPNLIGRVSYVAGDGNDVALTLVAAGPELLTVSNTADSGPGSLRAALNYALQRPGTDTILLDPSLSGQAITLRTPLHTFGEPITLDARTLPAGLIIDGGESTGLFIIDGSASLHGLTLRHGHSNNEGGAILAGELPGSVLTITHCAFIDNYSGDDGGAIYMEEGTLHMEHCTLAGNFARIAAARLPTSAATSSSLTAPSPATPAAAAVGCHLQRCHRDAAVLLSLREISLTPARTRLKTTPPRRSRCMSAMSPRMPLYSPPQVGGIHPHRRAAARQPGHQCRHRQHRHQRPARLHQHRSAGHRCLRESTGPPAAGYLRRMGLDKPARHRRG